MFVPRKTDKLTNLSKEEWQSITSSIPEKVMIDKLKEAKKINKKFKKITLKEALAILDKVKKIK